MDELKEHLIKLSQACHCRENHQNGDGFILDGDQKHKSKLRQKIDRKLHDSDHERLEEGLEGFLVVSEVLQFGVRLLEFLTVDQMEEYAANELACNKHECIDSVSILSSEGLVGRITNTCKKEHLEGEKDVAFCRVLRVSFPSKHFDYLLLNTWSLNRVFILFVDQFSIQLLMLLILEVAEES
jgi:hypothetical protein